MADVKKTVKSVSEQIKSETGRKLVIGAIGLLTVLVVVVLFTVIPYTITPGRLKEASFWTDLLMIAAIVIITTIIMLYMSKSRNAASAISNIALATVAFNASKAVVRKKGLNNFKRWIKEVFEIKDKNTIKQRILDEAGISQSEVLELSEPQLKELVEHPCKFNDMIYRKINKSQFQVIQKIQKHGIKFKFVDADYWITIKGLTGNKTRSERAQKEGVKKALYFLVSLGGKILLTLIISVIFTVFTKDIISEPASVLETSSKMAFRLMAFTTSMFLGYMLGIKLNDIDAEYIEMRTDTQLEFIQDKEFTCKSIDEEANDEYIAWMKKEQMKPMQLEQRAHIIEYHENKTTESNSSKI